jgi:hypothetical protein
MRPRNMGTTATVGCEHTIVEAEAPIGGSAPARAQDDRVGVSRQDPDACVVDVQTLCLRGCVAPSSRLADLFGRRQNVVDHTGRVDEETPLPSQQIAPSPQAIGRIE